MKVILAQPRGFCAGVIRAIDIVKRAVDQLDEPVYVRHEIVHNAHVVDDLRRRGATFVEEVSEIPEGAAAVFSAHGVSRAVVAEAAARGLDAIDATCPLVEKVHRQVHRLERLGYDVLLIGHAGHPEVEGTMGQVQEPSRIRLVQTLDDARTVEVPPGRPLAYVTQTTLSLDDTAEIIAILKQRFPRLEDAPTDDICYATQDRQVSVKRLAQQADVVLVVGAANSSNSVRLAEVARSAGTPAYRIASVEELRDEWLEGANVVALTAGASVPEELVGEVVEHLRRTYGAEIVEDEVGVPEHVRFPLPARLRED
jgi:4-hydroxy-3-methylbut-2-enyl diphosphate reductase